MTQLSGDAIEMFANFNFSLIHSHIYLLFFNLLKQKFVFFNLVFLTLYTRTLVFYPFDIIIYFDWIMFDFNLF